MVLSGAYITCKDTRLACIRHLKDIHKSIESSEWNYTYKPKRAKKVIKFIEALPDTKGNINKLGLFQNSLSQVFVVGLLKTQTCCGLEKRLSQWPEKVVKAYLCRG